MARHRPSALRVATVVLGHAGEADDVVQVAIERAMAALDRFDTRRAFRPWFLHIVANGARNHRRAGWRRRRAELRVASATESSSADDPALEALLAARRVALVGALNRLSMEDRLVISLRHFEQLNEREMADVLACAPGTVKSRLARATQRLRAELDRMAVNDV